MGCGTVLRLAKRLSGSPKVIKHLQCLGAMLSIVGFGDAAFAGAHQHSLAAAVAGGFDVAGAVTHKKAFFGAVACFLQNALD